MEQMMLDLIAAARATVAALPPDPPLDDPNPLAPTVRKGNTDARAHLRQLCLQYEQYFGPVPEASS
jgi:hypothetical protein